MMLKRGSISGLLVFILVASVLLVACAKPAPTPVSKPPATTSPPQASKPAATTVPSTTPKPAQTAKPAATPTAPAAPKAASPAFPPKTDVKMPQFLRIMGGTTVGTGIDLMCEGATQMIREAMPNVAARHWPGTSLEGLSKVQAGLAEMTGASPISMYQAFTGKGVEKPCTDLRVLYQLPLDIFYCMVALKQKDDIKTIADLKNKRIGTNEKGSQADLCLQEAVLPAYQLSYKSIESNGGLIYRGPTTTLLSMLAAGELDAIFTAPSHPFGPITVLHMERGIKFIELSDEAVKAMVKNSPGQSAGTVPAEAYKGVPAYKTAGVGYALVAHKNMADDVAYNVTAASFISPERWWHFVPTIKGSDILSNATADFIIPVHPGAEKYWKARNIPIKYSPLAVGLGK